MIKNPLPEITISFKFIQTLVERLVFFFRSITIAFQNNFPPAVRHIFWAERQPKRILASIGARENVFHSNNYFKVKIIKICNDFFIYLVNKKH